MRKISVDYFFKVKHERLEQNNIILVINYILPKYNKIQIYQNEKKKEIKNSK